MPTSTAWRRPLGGSEFRLQSPPRPPRDAIERLSPEPFADSSTSATPSNWASYQNAQHTAQGLGLFLANSNNAETTYNSNSQLWTDQDGQARAENFGTTSNGDYRNGLNGHSGHESYRMASKKDRDPTRGRSKAHARSSSNIDALATIALATSPTFTNQSPTTPQTSWTPTLYSNGYDYTTEERPAKRARSEKLRSLEFPRKESRPATSHVSSYDNMREHAELLLNFAQPQNFLPLQTPPTIYHIEHRSPSYKRLSASTTSSEEAAADRDAAITKSSARNAPLESSAGQYIKNGLVGSPTVLEGQLWTVPSIKDLKSAENNEDNSMLSPQIEEASLNGQLGHGREVEISEDFDHRMGAINSPDVESSVKKPRRIKPIVQATSCAGCNLLQSNEPERDEESTTFWISCNGCRRWFHSACAGFKDKREAQTVDKYICPDCEPIHGATTYVRKSSRARTAIDYAGLNEGIIKPSVETPEHHFLQPIKDGKITFQPDDFARIRPEFVTADHFEKTDGMKRPIVIPACWNPRFGVRSVKEAGSSESSNVKSASSEMDVDGEENEEDIFECEEVIDCDQDLLDMVMPRDLTVRKVSELYGPEERVEVIDVKSQSQGDKKWNMRKWADYYESTEDKVVRNVISLEVSQSPLGRLIRRPRIVRDLDLQDAVWPAELQAMGDYPKVQFYCLMSVADCYTDFHIDFGGSSVYYHILKGKKTFFFIPPEDKNLKKYEEWCNSETQGTTFLGDVTGECSRVDLSEGDTMLIPAGWIHAVWTPEDSLVIGGNFLTRQNYEMQIKVANIERDTKVARKFRYPFFQKIMWYAAMNYLEEDPLPQEVLDEYYSDPEFVFLRANPVWHEFGDLANDKEPGDEYFNARFYSRKEIEGLPALRDYLYRTALIAGGFHVPGVTVEATRNVKRSIPRAAGDPLELIKTFGIWCAWKIGGVVAPTWTRPDAKTMLKLAEAKEKLKQPEVMRTPPERTSSRVASQMETARANQEATAVKRSVSLAGYESEEAKKPRTTPKTSGLGPKRVACDACRKRRIRCRHKEDGDAPSSFAPNPRPRTYSTTSVDAGAINQSPVGAMLETPGPSRNAYPDISTDRNAALIPTQDAVAGIGVHDGDPMQESPTTAFISSSKKGRSKACDECRKSKRRCIHDEFGRVDPAKAAEPSKPRGSASVKRPPRASDEFKTAVKKQKVESGLTGSDAETVLVAQSALAEFQNGQNEQFNFDGLIDPALMNETVSAPATAQPTEPHVIEGAQHVEETDDSKQPAKETTPPPANENSPMQGVKESKAEPVEEVNLFHPTQVPTANESPSTSAVVAPASSQTPARSLASPPDSLLHDHFSPSTLANGEITHSIETIGDGSDSSTNPLHTPNSASRHSSRQPKQVDRYVPEIPSTVRKPAQDSSRFSRRASSSGVSALTDLESTSRKSSVFNGATGAVAEQKAKAVSPTTSQRRETSGPRSSFDDPEMDEESLKLIRAIQEQEFGLRRRGNRDKV